MNPEQMQLYGMELARRAAAVVDAAHNGGPREIVARVLHAQQLRHPAGADPAIALAVTLAAAIPDARALLEGLDWVRECDPHTELPADLVDEPLQAADDTTIDDPDANYERTDAPTVHPDDVRFLMSPAGGSLTSKQIAERLHVDVKDVKAAQRQAATLTSAARTRKLSDAQVTEIRARVAAGEHPRDVAEQVGTSKSNVYNILAGRARAVPLEETTPAAERSTA